MFRYRARGAWLGRDLYKCHDSPVSLVANQPLSQSGVLDIHFSKSYSHEGNDPLLKSYGTRRHGISAWIITQLQDVFGTEKTLRMCCVNCSMCYMCLFIYMVTLWWFYDFVLSTIILCAICVLTGVLA